MKKLVASLSLSGWMCFAGICSAAEPAPKSKDYLDLGYCTANVSAGFDAGIYIETIYVIDDIEKGYIRRISERYLPIRSVEDITSRICLSDNGCVGIYTYHGKAYCEIEYSSQILTGNFAVKKSDKHLDRIDLLYLAHSRRFLRKEASAFFRGTRCKDYSGNECVNVVYTYEKI